MGLGFGLELGSELGSELGLELGLGIGFESKLGSPGRKGPNPLRHEGSELDEQAAIVRPQKLFSQKSTVACT